MFTPPRFVVVDDEQDHLNRIVQAVQRLGSSCAAILYTPLEDVPVDLFSGARVVFMDLQLISKAVGSDFRPHFAEIQRILTRVRTPQCGPYVLVLWTEVADRVDDLREYLEENFFPKFPHGRPIEIVALSKHDYFELGEASSADRDLRGDIAERLGAYPAMNALVTWESEVLAAAQGVLANVIGLSDDFESAVSLGGVLKRLASAAVGAANVEADPRASLQSALLPLLQDALQEPRADAGVWAAAFDGSSDEDAELSREQAASLNARLHVVDSRPGATVSPADWGAMSEIERDMRWGEFGLSDENQFVSDVLGNSMNINLPEYLPGISVVQIRVGAACDYAQRSLGPIPFVLAAFLPKKKGNKGPHKLKESSTAWLSPELTVRGAVGQIWVNPRYVRIRGESDAAGFVAFARVREQLLMELVEHIGHHSARPGIVRFDAKKD